jgi:glutaconate CoA-transferase subunit B
MTRAPWTRAEMMTVVAARALRGGTACFVGIGRPSTAANLAKRTFAPDLCLVYESGTIGVRLDELPLSIGDDSLALTAQAVVSVPEIFNYWLQPGRIDVGFLSAAQIDRFGNVNTTLIGADHDRPDVRLPGSGGAPEILGGCTETFVVVPHRRRTFVEQVDFVTSVGHGRGPDDRARLGLRGAGPTKVITDLAVLAPDANTCELVVHGLYPGVTRDDVQAETGWRLRFADAVATVEPPSSSELCALRALEGRLA